MIIHPSYVEVKKTYDTIDFKCFICGKHVEKGAVWSGSEEIYLCTELYCIDRIISFAIDAFFARKEDYLSWTYETYDANFMEMVSEIYNYKNRLEEISKEGDKIRQEYVLEKIKNLEKPTEKYRPANQKNE